MERQYRIVSSQSSGDHGHDRAIYCLLIVTGKEKSVRILIDRRPDWEVGKVIMLDPAFVEANKEPE